MDQSIQIRADVDRQDANVCKFTVDRTVIPGKSVFNSEKDAKGNALAEKIFAISKIQKIEVQDNFVTITKESSDDWRVIGKRIGQAIRNFINPPAERPDALPQELVRQKVQDVLN